MINVAVSGALGIPFEGQAGTLNAITDVAGVEVGHVTREQALEAMAKAGSGPVPEGVVGGGTGMVCNGFKGGIGTASRTFESQGKQFTVGVLVQCNYNWGGEGFRLDDKQGSIEPGKRADFVVLDRNLFEIPSSEISEAEVTMTVFDGRTVYTKVE